MSLLYRGLRQVLSLAVELYFLDVQATGRENIPAEGPLIFAANHPNSIMDSVILGTQTSRKISYMAKSDLFRNPVVAWIFKECGVIPIHRDPKATGGNEDAFRRAYEVLEESGTIGIFPEGRNSRERGLFEIKTGTARIALNTERRNDYTLGVRILPVGLNFEDRDRFLSAVLLRFGEPIDVRRYAQQHREDEREAVRALTEEIAERLRELATHIEGDRALDLVRDIHAIYGHELLDVVTAQREEQKRAAHLLFDDLREGSFDDDALLEDLMAGSEERDPLFSRLVDQMRRTSGPKEDLEEKFWLKQRIADAVTFYERTDPELVREIRLRIWRYKDHLRQVQLRHDFVDRPPETLSFRKEALRFTAYGIVWALPAIWGFLHNMLPYFLTRWAALRPPDEAQRAITALLVGSFLFPLCYAPAIYGIWYATHDVWWTLAYALSLPTAGFFFLRYRQQLAKYRDRVLTRTLFQTEKHMIESLVREREKLIATFDVLRERFVAAEEDPALSLTEEPASGAEEPPERPQPSSMTKAP